MVRSLFNLSFSSEEFLEITVLGLVYFFFCLVGFDFFKKYVLYSTFTMKRKNLPGDILHNRHPSHFLYMCWFSKTVLKLFFTCLRAFHNISPAGMLYTFNFYLEVFLHLIIHLYCSILTTVLLNNLLSKKKCKECIKRHSIILMTASWWSIIYKTSY